VSAELAFVEIVVARLGREGSGSSNPRQASPPAASRNRNAALATFTTDSATLIGLVRSGRSGSPVVWMTRASKVLRVALPWEQRGSLPSD